MISDYPDQLFNSLSLTKPTNGQATKPRLSCPRRTQEMVHMLIYANRDRSLTLATVKGMLDGNAPFSHSKLIAQGQGQRTNVNFREGEAMLSGAETPYYDLFAESTTYFKFEGEHPDPYKRSQWSRIVTTAYDDMLKAWDGFDYNIQRVIHEMVAFGPGFAMWADPVDWQFSAIQHSRVLVPDGTLADADHLELLVVRQSLNVSSLYKKVRNPESARKLGWNPNAVMAAIAGAVPETRNDTTAPDYEKIQEEIRNHDLYESARSDVIRLANVFVREFSGKISHLIVEERNAIESRAIGGVKPEDVNSPQFLYKKIGRYNSFREVLAAFFFDIGDGTWHSVKGLGVKQYPFIEIKNRLNCSLVDSAFINLSVLLQAMSGRSEQETALMQMGPMTILPANFEMRQWNMQGRMEEGLFVERALTSKLENNTGQYRRSVRESGNPETATGRTIDAQKEASLAKGAVNRFYTQLDSLGEEMFRRSTNFNLIPEDNGRGPNCMALKFQQKCLDAGVPKSFLKKYRYVRASRNSGNGSVFLRQQVIRDTMPIVPMFNEEGKQNWIDHAVAVLAGSENVDLWNPKQTYSPTVQNEQAYALLENDAMSAGSPVMVTSTQNSLIHATTHLKAATDAVNSIPQGGDPMSVLTFLDVAGPHISQHLQVMAGDQMRGNDVKTMLGQLKQLGKIADKIKMQVAKAQEQKRAEMERQQKAMADQQARTNEVLTNEQLRQLEVTNKLQLSREKADATMRMRQERHTQDAVLKQQRAEQELTTTDALVATDIRAKTAKTSADIVNQTRKAEASTEKS